MASEELFRERMKILRQKSATFKDKLSAFKKTKVNPILAGIQEVCNLNIGNYTVSLQENRRSCSDI